MTGPRRGLAPDIRHAELDTFRSLAGEPDPRGEPDARFPATAEMPLDNFEGEDDLASRVLDRLRPHFVVAREVWGTHCSGRRVRIDAVIKPRHHLEWKDHAVAFGVEFKMPPRGAGTRAYTGWLAQAVDYAHVKWDGLGRRLLIFACPGVTTWLDERRVTDPHDPTSGLAKRIAGQLGIGELVLRWSYGLTFVWNDEHVWSERYGVVRGKQWALRPKVGSR